MNSSDHHRWTGSRLGAIVHIGFAASAAHAASEAGSHDAQHARCPSEGANVYHKERHNVARSFHTLLVTRIARTHFDILAHLLRKRATCSHVGEEWDHQGNETQDDGESGQDLDICLRSEFNQNADSTFLRHPARLAKLLHHTTAKWQGRHNNHEECQYDASD